MKRIAAVLLLCFLLTGCRDRAASFVPTTAGFSCAADVTAGEFSFSCALNVDREGALTAVLTEPSPFAGLRMELNQDGARIGFGDFDTGISADALPRFSFAAVTKEALARAASAAFQPAEEGYRADGYAGGGAFSFLFRADGFPLTLSLPAAGLSVTFRDFALLT